MKELFQLVLPVVLTYVGITFMGFVDLLFVGRVSAAAIGAVGFGSSLFAWFLVFGMGLTSGLDFLISHAHGAKERQKQHLYLSQGLLLSFWGALPLTAVLVIISLHLEWFGINPEIREPAEKYSLILAFSLLPAYLFNVMRLYLTSMGIARPAMVLLLVGNVCNALVDYVLVLGRWGAPALGAEGSAWATLLSRVLMAVALAGYLLAWDKKNGNFIARLKIRYQKSMMRDLVKLGVPASLQMTFEVGVFAVATGLAARLSADEMAAHQIVLNTASMAFMVPLGIGTATAVLVGQALGRREFSGAAQMGWRGFRLGVGFMALSSATLFLFAEPILGIFTHDPHIILFGKNIIWIAALFQLSDGAQTVGTGALRGLGDTHSAMIYNLVGHWLIGLPVGTLLCFKWGWGLQGLWIGLSLGLTFVAGGVLLRWWQKTRFSVQ
jgi:MATE family multidrug resistance protein